jgi:hypothetical protein
VNVARKKIIFLLSQTHPLVDLGQYYTISSFVVCGIREIRELRWAGLVARATRQIFWWVQYKENAYHFPLEGHQFDYRLDNDQVD